jgi:hypothetical protein
VERSVSRNVTVWKLHFTKCTRKSIIKDWHCKCDVITDGQLWQCKDKASPWQRKYLKSHLWVEDSYLCSTNNHWQSMCMGQKDNNGRTRKICTGGNKQTWHEIYINHMKNKWVLLLSGSCPTLWTHHMELEAARRKRGYTYGSSYDYPWHEMGAGDQHHATAPGRTDGTQSTRGWEGLGAGVDGCGKSF